MTVTHHRPRLVQGATTALVLAVCLVVQTGKALSDEIVLRDLRQRVVGTIEPSPIYPEKLVVRDERGRRLGTIEPDAINKDVLVIRDERGRRVGTIER